MVDIMTHFVDSPVMMETEAGLSFPEVKRAIKQSPEMNSKFSSICCVAHHH